MTSQLVCIQDKALVGPLLLPDGPRQTFVSLLDVGWLLTPLGHGSNFEKIMGGCGTYPKPNRHSLRTLCHLYHLHVVNVSYHHQD
jgi:hypothetical protein